MNDIKKTGEKLIKLAQARKEKYTEKLNQPRCTNTPKRARVATGIENDCRRVVAFCETAERIGAAMVAGELKLLQGIKSLTDIEHVQKIDGFLRRHAGRFPELYKIDVWKSNLSEIIDYMPDLHLEVHINLKREFLKIAEETKGKREYYNRLLNLQWIEKEYARIDCHEFSKFKALITGHEKDFTGYFIDDVKWMEALIRMNLKGKEELKSALLEFTRYKVAKQEEDPIKKLEREMVGVNLGIDFFPTPKSYGMKLIELADIKSGMGVLEPSAGKGDLADLIRGEGVEPDVIEVSYTLQQFLSLKKYTLIGTDFLEFSGKQYDRIVMNPPFSNNKDIQHVRHAYDLLSENGRIVAIMSPHYQFAEERESREFREWISDKIDHEEKVDGGFNTNEAYRKTGVSSVIIVLTK